MLKRTTAAVAVMLLVAAVAAVPAGAGAGSGRASTSFTPGAAGIGDDYFPLAGNGGYDVRHYSLNVRYKPRTDEVRGVAAIVAEATQNLSSFNLDLVGLNVRWVKVNGVKAAFSRDGGELTVVPRWGLRKHHPFTVLVKYEGVPEPVVDASGVSGFLATDDGALVAGQPFVASTWYPVNDHPLDTATYTFKITVPNGLESIANGVLADTWSAHGWTTSKWIARQPMASYLATMTVGDFDLREYRAGGLKYWDAVDPDLFDPVAPPHSGEQLAISQQAQQSYKRLARTIAVPDGASTLSFWVLRDTESEWDHFFVEARTPGGDDWTTLPEVNGITSVDGVSSCPSWLALHPFLLHYQADNGDGTCVPSGSTGSWHAASGASDGYEQWTVDLGAYAGSSVEISLAYVSDDTVQGPGVFIDDIVVTGGDGSTGFEDDGDAFDGWTVPGAPPDSIANENDWTVGTVADGPAPVGANVDASLARQPEIIDFLEGFFGDYPFDAAGGIVDDYRGLGFALENQTRPVYAQESFADPLEGDAVVVHELAHQWFGDDLPLAAWQHIWLNEGFATYAEWLWSEREGLGTPQEIFDFYTMAIPEEHPFWSLSIGDPGPDLLFEQPVYLRGAMALHALRMEVGEPAFFTIIRKWAAQQSGSNVTTDELLALAERVSGRELDELFQIWVHATTKPVFVAQMAVPPGPAAGGTAVAPAIARAQLKRLGLTTS